MQHRIEIRFFPGFFIQLAVLMLILPLRWVFAILIAGSIHELSHILALCAFKIPIRSITIKTSGAYMETGFMETKQEILCALAGPVGGFLVLFLGAWVPRIAICCVLHSLYNLFPIYPSDGGRALYRCLQYLFPDGIARSVYLIIKWGMVLSSVLIGLFLFLIPGIGVFPILIGVFLALRAFWADSSILDKSGRRAKLISKKEFQKEMRYEDRKNSSA